MAFGHGKNTKVLFGKYNLSEYLNESTVSQNVDVAEATTYGKSAKVYLVGQADGTVSLGGLFDGSPDASDEVMQAAIGDNDGRYLSVATEGFAHGNGIHLVHVKSTSYEISSPVADVVSLSAEVQAEGGVDRGISLADLASVSSTANGTAHDNSASSTNGGVAHLHVPVNDRNGSVTVKIQHSADNTTWADLITFTAVTASTTTSQRVEVSGTVNRYLRAQHTVAGSTGATTYQTSFARK